MFYRTSAGVELDLVLEFGGEERWAIEVKRSLSPSVTKGFQFACEDVRSTHRYLVYPGAERFPLAGDIEAIALPDPMQLLRSRS